MIEKAAEEVVGKQSAMRWMLSRGRLPKLEGWRAAMLDCEDVSNARRRFRDDMFSLSVRRVSAMIVRVRRCLRFRELTCKNLRIDCKVELVLGGRGCVVRD